MSRVATWVIPRLQVETREWQAEVSLWVAMMPTVAVAVVEDEVVAATVRLITRVTHRSLLLRRTKTTARTKIRIGLRGAVIIITTTTTSRIVAVANRRTSAALTGMAEVNAARTATRNVNRTANRVVANHVVASHAARKC